MPRAASLAAAVVALTGCAMVEPPPRANGVAASPVAARAAGETTGGFGEPEPPDTAADTSADTPEGATPDARLDDAVATSDLRARLGGRARRFLGLRGPFRAAGERFNGDCSGLAQAVYAAEGIDLRGLMQRAAPRERRGVRAAWLAARTHGSVFGAEASPEPGDIVFWHDTYDRNRNGKADDRFTHLGIVEHVEDGTVTFIHRGGKGVARGVMTLGRRSKATAPGGKRVNSILRAASHPVKDGGLAGELFAGYGRIDGARLVGGGGARASATAPRPSPRAGSRAERGRAPAKTATSTAKATRPSRPTSISAGKASRTTRPAAGERAGATAKKKPAAPAKPPTSAATATRSSHEARERSPTTTR